MAQDTSTYLRNAILNAVFNGGTALGAATASTITPYISLHTADPGLTGANEVVGGSYARQAGTFATASTAGSISNTSVISFTNMPATTVLYAGAWDAATSGNFLFRAAISVSKTTNAGDTFQIAVGNITFTEV